MQYRIEGGSLPALIINLNPGETIIFLLTLWRLNVVDNCIEKGL